MRLARLLCAVLALVILTGCETAKENSLRRAMTNLAAKFQVLKAGNRGLRAEVAGEVFVQQTAEVTPCAAEVYPWLRRRGCDKIVVYRPGVKQLEIGDPAIAKHMPDFLWLGAEFDPPNPPIPDVPRYTYVFVWGKESHAIKVATSSLVEIEGRYFRCENGQNLGNAFLPAPCYMRTDYIEAKIAQSGMVMGEPGSGLDLPCLETARIICFANALCEAEQLPSSPANPGQTRFVLTFYRFGERLLMKGHEKHIEVIEGARHHWYQHDDAGLLYTILTAG